MSLYSEHVNTSWEDVLRSRSSPLEKLDALMWVNIHALDRFSDEFKIQLAWLRQSPPSSPNMDFSFRAQLRQLKALLTEGSRAGDIHIEGASADIRARCVFEAIMMPPSVIRAAGTQGAHALARDTVLRGVATGSRVSRP
jgi:hypothetical protein